MEENSVKLDDNDFSLGQKFSQRTSALIPGGITTEGKSIPGMMEETAINLFLSGGFYFCSNLPLKRSRDLLFPGCLLRVESGIFLGSGCMTSARSPQHLP